MRAADPVLGLSLRQHIGGRWAISLLAFVVAAPVNLVSIASNADRSAQGSTAWQWITVALLGYLALGIVMWIADRTVFRHRRTHPLPIAAVVALGLLAGLARGVVVGLLPEAWGLSEPGLLLTRIVTSASLGAVLTPLAALTFSIIATYLDRRRELVAQRAALIAEGLQADGATRAMREALIDSMRGDLEEVARTQDPELARKVSHDVWSESGQVSELRLHWSRVVVACLVRNPFPAGTVSAIWALSAWGALAAALGWPRAAAQLAFSVSIIIVFFWIGRRWAARTGTSAVAFPVVVLVVTLATGPLASILFDPRPLGDGARLIVANTVWMPTLIVLVGIAFSAVRSGQDVLDDLAGQVSAAEVSALAAEHEQFRVRQELATTLHGTVQSRLLTAAALIRQPAIGAQAGVEASDVLDALMVDLAAEDSRGLGERVDDVVRPWSSLMSIDLSVEVAESPQDTAIVRVLEEALSNAYRHGGATHVTCIVESTDGMTTITVTDDGVGVDDGSRGLGSALFDSLATHGWSREQTAQGHRLVVCL